MDYVLKSKDKSVLSFSIDKEVELVDDIQDISYQLKVNSVEDASLLPISVEPTDTSVSAWLMRRKSLTTESTRMNCSTCYPIWKIRTITSIVHTPYP